MRFFLFVVAMGNNGEKAVVPNVLLALVPLVIAMQPHVTVVANKVEATRIF